MKRLVVGVTLAAILLLVNYNIWQKEQHIASGERVYLQLAPVDPRSLMQGDYMTLRFALSADLQSAHRADKTLAQAQAFDGALVARLDEHRVAHFVRLADAKPLQDNEVRLQYRVRNNRIKFATNAYFFKEGTGAQFTSAEYGQFRVNEQGEPLLMALYSKHFERLGPESP